MPSALYNKMLATIGHSIGVEKAEGVVLRQLKRCEGATPATFSKADLDRILTYLILATALYIPDKSKQADLAAMLKGLT